MKSKLVTPLVAAALLLTVGGGIAAADPAPARLEIIPITCAGQTFTIRVVVTANGQEKVNTFNPGLVQGSTGVLVPLQFTFTATQNGQVIFGPETITKGGSLTALQNQGKVTTCSFSIAQGGGITLNGTVLVLMTPQGG